MSDTEYLLVTEYFHPETASTGTLMTDLAVGLHRRGLDVSVLTGQPHYHAAAGRQPRRSEYEGVEIRRVRAPQLAASSLPRRLFNWVLFTLWTAALLLVSRSAEHDRRHVLFVSNPPFLPAALWFVCRARGWSYTYIVHDLYPDNLVVLGHIAEDGVVHRGWQWLQRRTIRDAERVVALGPEMKRCLCRVAGTGFDADVVTPIHNWQDETFIVPVAKRANPFSEEHGLVEPFTLVYSGNIGEWHDLETLLRAAPRFDDDDVRFLIIGEGENKSTLKSLARSLGVDGETVAFLPYQPFEVLPYSLTAGDVSVVATHEGLEGISVSSKLYSALATGRPVLCIAQEHDDAARVVAEFDAGLVVPQGDVAGIEAAIERWRSEPTLVERQGANARRAFEDHFTRSQAVDDYYRVLTGESPPSGSREATPGGSLPSTSTP